MGGRIATLLVAYGAIELVILMAICVATGPLVASHSLAIATRVILVKGLTAVAIGSVMTLYDVASR